jgi:hypothetical protein
MSVAFFIKHVKPMRRIIFSFVACLVLPCFSILSNKRALRKRFAFVKIIFFQKNSRVQTFDHKRDEEILEELKVEPAEEKL